MKRAGSIPLFSSLCLVLAAASSFAQEAGHQRVRVETEARHRLEASLACSWSPAGKDWSADCEASVEYVRDRALGLGLAMPWTLSSPGPSRWGDPGASISYHWEAGRFRAQAGLRYGFPLARRKDAGFHRFAPSLSLALARDPVILTLGASFATCLPREVDGRLLWPAFSGSLSLSCWELLNDRVSYRIGVSPGLDLGTIRLGRGGPIVPSWRVGLSLTLSWDERAWGLQAGWSGRGESAAGSADARATVRGEW
jgi:hypothetical protein